MAFRRLRPNRSRPRLDLRKTLFVLPNLITLASIFCGFNAIRIVAKDGATVDDFYRSAVLLIFAMFFDLMDGRVARMTKTQSAFGLQIDSLADVVSFGVAPALLVYKWVLYRHPVAGPAHRVPVRCLRRGSIGSLQRAHYEQRRRAEQAGQVHHRPADSGRLRDADRARGRQPRHGRRARRRALHGAACSA